MKLLLPSALGLAILLSSCGNMLDSMDESEIPDYTKNWLHNQHGEVLTFRSSTGQVRTLTVARKRHIRSGTNQIGKFEHEIINVWYRSGPDSLLNMALEARANYVHVSKGGDEFASFLTNKSDGRTMFYSRVGTSSSERIVAWDTTFSGQPYRYLGRVVVPPTAGADTVTAVYFSRYNGLIGFTTKRAGTWHRQ
ncbi:hypothetical protein [Hymenobacter algoricola]|uniref:Lipoprotein n=1 Tax=Hymenobacter algoricola TaxID=486267 RepID=A0ABP7MJ29_9BACT